MATATTPLDTIGFRLGTQELLYLLDVLELKTIPSLGPNPLDAVSPEQKKQILAAGFNSLRAKEWIKLSNDTQHPVVIDKLFATPFFICASARKIMTITNQNREQFSQQVFLFKTPEVLVSHRISEPGVHEFIMTSVKEKLAELVIEFMELAGVEPVTQPASFWMPPEKVTNFMAAVANRDMSKMGQILNGIEAAKPYTQSLLDCYKNLQHTVVIMQADFPENMTSADQVVGKTISIFSAPPMAWKIENDVKNAILFTRFGQAEAAQLTHEWMDA
jgi:hypothetical protein